jgi:hypothetical protein
MASNPKNSPRGWFMSPPIPRAVISSPNRSSTSSAGMNEITRNQGDFVFSECQDSSEMLLSLFMKHERKNERCFGRFAGLVDAP